MGLPGSFRRERGVRILVKQILPQSVNNCSALQYDILTFDPKSEIFSSFDWPENESNHTKYDIINYFHFGFKNLLSVRTNQYRLHNKGYIIQSIKIAACLVILNKEKTTLNRQTAKIQDSRILGMGLVCFLETR